MLFRKAALVFTLLLVLATIGLAVWFWKTQNRFYSSPTAPRTNQTYLRAHAPAMAPLVVPTNLYGSLSIDRATNQIVVSMSGVMHSGTEVDYEPLAIHKADASQAIRIGEGSVRLAYIGVAQAQPLTNFDHGLQVEAQYFTPEGKPVLDAGELKMMPAYMRTLSFEGAYPASQFVFIYSNIANLKTLKFQSFDAGTHASLASGYSSSAFTNGFYYGTTLQLWHQTPIELVATVATGPIETFTIPAREGAELSYPEGQLKLLLISEENLGGWSSRNDGGTNTMTFKLGRRTGYWGNRKSTSFLFHSWPQGWAIPIDFEFVDVNGKKIDGLGAGSSGNFLMARAEADSEQIKEVRVKYYSKKHRLIFTIPELQGLPEENRNVENLFEVRIPYMYMRYEWDFQYGIGKLLQMEQQHFALTFPNGYFPTFRTNTTPRELFLEMESLLSNQDQQLVADPVKNEIRVRKHPLWSAIDAVKKKWGL